LSASGSKRNDLESVRELTDFGEEQDNVMESFASANAQHRGNQMILDKMSADTKQLGPLAPYNSLFNVMEKNNIESYHFSVRGATSGSTSDLHACSSYAKRTVKQSRRFSRRVADATRSKTTFDMNPSNSWTVDDALMVCAATVRSTERALYSGALLAWIEGRSIPDVEELKLFHLSRPRPPEGHQDICLDRPRPPII
jgi:hypothetical protein